MHVFPVKTNRLIEIIDFHYWYFDLKSSISIYNIDINFLTNLSLLTLYHSEILLRAFGWMNENNVSLG